MQPGFAYGTSLVYTRGVDGPGDSKDGPAKERVPPHPAHIVRHAGPAAAGWAANIGDCGSKPREGGIGGLGSNLTWGCKKNSCPGGNFLRHARGVDF